MTKWKKEFERLKTWVEKEMAKSGGKLFIYPTPMVTYEDEGECSGYFTYPDKANPKIKRPEIHMGTKKSLRDTFGILLHEFCHFRQYIKKTKAWVEAEKCYNHETVANRERECEVMAVRLLKTKFKDTIPVKRYIKRANAYLLFHRIWELTGHWSMRPSYESPAIIRHMPDTLVHPFDDKVTISPKLLRLFMEQIYPNDKGVKCEL